MLIESVRTFTVEDVESGQRPHLGPLDGGVFLHGEKEEWPLDVRAILMLPEELGKGTLVSGNEVDLDAFEPIFFYSRMDVVCQDSTPVSSIRPALEWVLSRIDQMNDPALIVIRDNITIRYTVREQRRVRSELEAHLQNFDALLSKAKVSDDRIVMVDPEDEDEGTEA